MLGSIQNFVATPTDCGRVGELELDLPVTPCLSETAGAPDATPPPDKTPKLEPAAACRNWRRFVRCDIAQRCSLTFILRQLLSRQNQPHCAKSSANPIPSAPAHSPAVPPPNHTARAKLPTIAPQNFPR